MKKKVVQLLQYLLKNNTTMKSLSRNLKTTLIVILINTALFAQNGEALFKAKCNTCHMVDKNSTGPILKGVIEKWNDAGEGEMLYEWVKNSPNLIASGKSSMANEIKGFNPTDMPAQQVTNEEIDAILNYVDNYTPPVAAAAAPTVSGEAPVTIVTNYKENLKFFYWLVTALIIILIGIIIMSTSVINLAKSDFFKKKLVEKQKEDENTAKNGTSVNTTLLSLILVVLFTGFYNSSFALSFMQPGEAADESLWLKVENSDLYFMITINIILLIVLFYIRNMFRNLLGMVKKPVEKVEKPQTIKKLNKILNDTVPIEEEHTILMQHEYDGIRELDNNLPPWWVWGFVATIIFAVIYLFDYHILKSSDLQIEAYNKEIAKSEKEVKAYLSKMKMNVDESSATLMTESDDLTKGKSLFNANCVACHQANGEGGIGPNLTDKHWIYGYDIKDVFKTVKYGTPNGMPEHNSKFNPIQIQQVSSYVLSLPFTEGKEAQGEIIEE